VTARILIAGGGVAGLAAASACLKFGLDPLVLEQAPELGQIGAGIQISPNGVKVLRALGLEAALLEAACEPRHYHARSWKTGRTLYKTPFNPELQEKYGAGHYHIHRADLLGVLKRGVPAEKIVLGERVASFEEAGHGIAVTTASGRRFTADFLLGADGIHSVVRGALFGADAPRFTGNIAWRFTVDADMVDTAMIPRDSCNWHGPRGHVVMYYVSGWKRINVVCIHETGEWVEESWSLLAGKDEVHEAYRGWHPVIHQLIDAAGRINKWALFDRDPMSAWSRGRATLIGDAAHPMLPFLAQGANQALEDAWVLAAALARDPSPTALQAYEAARLPRTSRIQLATRARAQTMHEASAWKRFLRDVRFRLGDVLNKRKTKHNVEWVYEVDVTREVPRAA
jgi:salicylate hydroxylase